MDDDENANEYVISYKNWRKQLCPGSVKPKEESKTKQASLSEEVKGKYLEYLEMHGQKQLAARMAGVAPCTVDFHKIKDPDFKTASEIVLELRSARIVRQLEKEALAGSRHIHFGKNGNVLNERVMYETPLRLAMLKKHGEGYVDKSEVDITTQGKPMGVVAVPTGLTVDEWKKKYEQQQADSTSST